MKKEFAIVFQISKKIVFNVSYYTCGTNSNPYFTTSADEFNQPKTDYDRGGQAQEALLPKGSVARKFWQKWDKKHLEDLSTEEYEDLLADLESLKKKYNYFFKDYSGFKKPYRSDIPFETVKDLSKMELANSKNLAIELCY